LGKQSTRHPDLLRQDDTILVVVDMQEPFLRTIWERDRLVRNVKILANAAKLFPLPMLSTVQNRARMGETIPEIGAVLTDECEAFDKICFSCLADKAIASEIERTGRKQVLLCGVETHICISQTAHDLITRGYQAHVVADAVSSRRQSDWEIGLRRAERAGAIVTSTEAAVYELLGQAGTPEFRALLALVK
jgi:nicotinamidase-related amidase